MISWENVITPIAVAVIGGPIVVMLNKKANKGIKKSQEAVDLSFPLQALRETIEELRIEINRLQTIIDGLNNTIASDLEKFKTVAKERDELIVQKERLENKVIKLEREKARLMARKPKTRKAEYKP